MTTCNKCGAVEQEREVSEVMYRWRKKEPRPPLEDGWVGPRWPAELEMYDRPKIERFYDCKFVCPNTINR
jgi:hypothetical protein